MRLLTDITGNNNLERKHDKKRKFLRVDTILLTCNSFLMGGGTYDRFAIEKIPLA